MAIPLVAAGAAIQLAKFLGPKVVGWVAGDKAGNVAQEVVDIAAQVTGAGTAEDALARLQADPQLVVQYRARAMEHLEALEAMYLADRQDARERDVELRKLGYRNYRADWMVGVAFLTLTIVITLVWQARDGMPPELVGFFSTAAGVLLKMLSDAFQFEFGSSRGSKEKDARAAGVGAVL